MTCHICVVSVSRWGGGNCDMSCMCGVLCLDGRTIVTCHVCVVSVSIWGGAIVTCHICVVSVSRWGGGQL